MKIICIYILFVNNISTKELTYLFCSQNVKINKNVQ